MDTRVSNEIRKHSRHRWTALGALLGVAGVGVIAWRVDFARLGDLAADIDSFWVVAVPLAIVLEQLIRAGNWRQLLVELKPVSSLRLLGAVMAGFLAGWCLRARLCAPGSSLGSRGSISPRCWYPDGTSIGLASYPSRSPNP